MTIYEVKRAVEAAGDTFYFSRDTMRFFGQNLKMFSVVKCGEYYRVSAPFGPGKPRGASVRYFCPKTGKLYHSMP